MLKVSILVPVKNGEDCIEDTILSVLNMQVTPAIGDNVELNTIVVDSGSTDKTREIVDKYEKVVTRIYMDTNKEITRLDNWSICLDVMRKAGGDWCKFLFAGDRLTQKSLAYQLAASKLGGFITGNHLVYPSSGVAPYGMSHFSDLTVFNVKEFLEISSKKGNWAAGCMATPLFHRDLLKYLDIWNSKSYEFDKALSFVSDWKFWVDLIASNPDTKVVYVPEVITEMYLKYRKHYTQFAGIPESQKQENWMKEYIKEKLKVCSK